MSLLSSRHFCRLDTSLFLSLLSSCHSRLNVTFVLLSLLSSCHFCPPVTSVLLSLLSSCHFCPLVTSIFLLLLSSCRLDTSTVPSCHFVVFLYLFVGLIYFKSPFDNFAGLWNQYLKSLRFIHYCFFVEFVNKPSIGLVRTSSTLLFLLKTLEPLFLAAYS